MREEGIVAKESNEAVMQPPSFIRADIMRQYYIKHPDIPKGPMSQRDMFLRILSKSSDESLNPTWNMIANQYESGPDFMKKEQADHTLGVFFPGENGSQKSYDSSENAEDLRAMLVYCVMPREKKTIWVHGEEKVLERSKEDIREDHQRAYDESRKMGKESLWAYLTVLKSGEQNRNVFVVLDKVRELINFAPNEAPGLRRNDYRDGVREDLIREFMRMTYGIRGAYAYEMRALQDYASKKYGKDLALRLNKGYINLKNSLTSKAA